MSFDVNPMEELCLVDSGTTNSILRKMKYFQTLKKREGNIMTITGHDALNSWFRSTHYHTPYGYTNNDRICLVVS